MTFDPNDPFGPTEADMERIRKELEKYDSPDEVEKRRRRREEEHAKGVRLGWWTEDGEPLTQGDEEECEDEDEDEE